jgi:alpha-D-ribose 1-methylphosphonate 5-triphosphate diphosphatase
MSSILISNARFPDGEALITGQILVKDGLIASIDSSPSHADLEIDGTGLMLMPGLVDIHGDAFERQIMPRPGVGFDFDLALLETDRQLIANGITTAFHAVTWSWEPGLRGAEYVLPLLAALERLQPRFAADTRIHLRHEVFNLDAESVIAEWLDEGRIDLIAFNDHMTATLKDSAKPDKRAVMVKRTGLSDSAFDALVAKVQLRADDVQASVERLASRAVKNGVTALSHDDATRADRIWFRERGVQIAEFPVTEHVAAEARAGGDAIVFGAPNVVRGGSHTGCPDATTMVKEGLCDVLASDYFYPALLNAPFVLAERLGGTPAHYWPLVSGNPARAAGLVDRGNVAVGLRADLILVESVANRPVVHATIAQGQLAHFSGQDRLRRAA